MKQGWSAAVVAAVAVVAVFIAAWLLWPRPATVTAPRARQYLDASACLLTGSHRGRAGRGTSQHRRRLGRRRLGTHRSGSHRPRGRRVSTYPHS